MRVDGGAGRAAVTALLIGVASCSTDASGPQDGVLRIAVVSTGAGVDFAGYSVSVDGRMHRPVPRGGSAVVAGLAHGGHAVALNGLPPDCTLAGPNPQNVSVTGTDTVTVIFQVRCPAATGTLLVITNTSGMDADANGYYLGVQNTLGDRVVLSLRSNHTAAYAEFAPGSYTATLTGVAGNCQLAEGTTARSFTILPGTITQLDFTLTCKAVPTILGFPFTDPPGDTLPGGNGTHVIDLLAVRGTYKPDSLIMSLSFSAPVAPGSFLAWNSLSGWIEFDTDENSATGISAVTDVFGGSTGLGVDYSVDLFSADAGLVSLTRSTGGSSRIPIAFAGDSVVVRIPLGALGSPSGNFRLGVIVGTPMRPTDLAPNSGVFVARRPTGPS